jgi:hypothetical protein
MADSRSAALGRRLLIPGLALLTYGLAFLQRPGSTVADTRIELSADPGLFLSRVAHVWSGTTDLGHVQSGQFTGYLFPMAPWYALGDWLGVPIWVLQRLWLGTLLFLAALGMVFLMRALLGRRDTVAELGAALVFALNPYVVLFTSRGTVTLLASTGLPWMMLAAHRGLRDPRGWRWPAFLGLLMAATGGGVNAAVIAFALLGPLLLVVYELLMGGFDRRAALSFGWRAALAMGVGSAWWAVPVLLQSSYGVDFLLFTEQPHTIWGTTSLSELLRLLGFWGLYTGVGTPPEPFISVASTYLYNPIVIVGTFAVPLFAFAAMWPARRWRYGPFFALLAVVSLLIMFAGFPEGTRLRAALIDVYNGVPSVQFLRTTYKAVPLLSLSLACLAGAGAAALAARAARGALRVRGRTVPAWSLAGLALVPAVAAAPLFLGRAVDDDQAYGSVPAAWSAALHDADRAQPEGTRTMVVPGELFGFYDWGGTMDPVGPAISGRPLAIREIVPYADPHSSQLQVVVDDQLQQGRILPRQLAPLLRLMDVGQVVVASDSRRERSGAIDPSSLERALARQPGLGGRSRGYGRVRTFQPPLGRSGLPVAVPQLYRRAVERPPSPGGVRVHPTAGATVMDGDAGGLVSLAALGLLDADRATLLAGDLDRANLRGAVAGGARLVFTDTSRKRAFISTRLRANRGYTIGPSDRIPPDSPKFDPFPELGDDARTVALYTGVRSISSPASGGFSQFPQFRPFAAVDGRLDTSWLADDDVPPRDWYLNLELARPVQARSVGIVPHATRFGRTVRVAVSVNGGPERSVDLGRGETRVPVDAPELSSIRVRTTKILGDPDRRGAGGIAELRVPGLRVRERLRLPVDLSRAARGLDLSRNEVVVALRRDTADFPDRAGMDRGEPADRTTVSMIDSEPGLEREVWLPVPRAFSLDGLASVDPAASDALLDRLVGLPAAWRFTSSSRFEGVPGRRASSAFDGDRRTAWIGDFGRRPAWVGWRSPSAVTFRDIRLERGPRDYPFPSRVVLTAPGTAPIRAAVGPGGRIGLPRPLTARALRLEVAAVARTRLTERRDLHAVAIGEVRVPGLDPPAGRRDGRFSTGCGAVRATAAGAPSSAAPIAVAGRVADLNDGAPLRARGCGRLRLGAGHSLLSVPAGPLMRMDELALRSPARRPAPAPASAGRVTSIELGGPGRTVDRARLALTHPAWLVLAQSYSEGWRAWCRGASGDERALGEPLPVDGFANGWRVGPGCREARFEFTPERTARLGFLVSGVGCLAMLAILAAGALRRRRLGAPAEAAAATAGPPGEDPLFRFGWPATIALAAGLAVAGGALFALRMGVVLGVLAVVMLRLGISVRRLLWIAVLGVAAMPVLYLVHPATDKGGFSFQYPMDQVLAHWIACVVVVCVAAAGTLSAWRLRHRRASKEPSRRTAEPARSASAA